MARCYDCQMEFDGYLESCPHCGHVNGSAPKEAYMLNEGIILNDRYIIGTVISFGGFGTVYKAWDQTLNTLVAIKEYYPSGMVNRVPGTTDIIVLKNSALYRTGIRQFLEEARDVAKFIQHPNIVNIYEYFEANNTAYMVMEFLDGLSLKEYLKTEGRLDVETAVYIISQVGKALSVVHAEGILHRDISPDNIFVCLGDTIKLIDFGAARFSDEEKDIILKPGYAPPEQYKKNGKQGPFTDLYALSATLYRMVTGIVPDESTNRLEEDTVVSPHELYEDIPESLSSNIVKGMAIVPEFRFQSVEEMMECIQNEKVSMNPIVERKRKIVKRGIQIGLLSIAIIILGCVAFGIFHKKEKFAKLEKATVTIWIPFDDSSKTVDQSAQLMKALCALFKKDYKNIDITVDAKPATGYDEAIVSAASEGKLPTVYYSSHANSIYTKNGYIDSDFFDFAETKKAEYLFYEQWKKEIQETKMIPIGFDMPVFYVADDNTFWTNAGIANEGDGNIFFTQDQATLGSVGSDELTRLTSFLTVGGNTPYYIGGLHNFRRVCDEGPAEDPLFTIRCKVYPLTKSQSYGYFADYWCVNKQAGDNERKAALRILNYYMGEESQQLIYVSEHAGVLSNHIPLASKIYANQFVGKVLGGKFTPNIQNIHMVRYENEHDFYQQLK